MSEVGGHAAANAVDTEAPGAGARRGRGRPALELVALRGKDVIGVRHLRPGGAAWVGNVADSLARVPARDLGGQPLVVGEVRGGAYTLHVPPRARARYHGADGIPRLVMGPHRIDLKEGERAVVVLGAVQIRAQVVPFEAPPGGLSLRAVAAWAAVAALASAALIAISTALAEAPRPRLDPGSLDQLHQRLAPPLQP